jgi:hypothetical protein
VPDFSYLLLNAPGTVFHEFAHSLFCRFSGVEVHKVVYFRVGNPAGYVVHAVPRHFRGQLAITSGPLIFNSLAAYVLFLVFLCKLIPLMHGIGIRASVIPAWTRLLPAYTPGWIDLLLIVVTAWLGLSSVLHAFPSDTDAKALWNSAGKHVRKGNLFALIGFPLAGFMYLASISKVVRVHWFYAAGMLWLAWLTLPLLAGWLGS